MERFMYLSSGCKYRWPSGGGGAEYYYTKLIKVKLSINIDMEKYEISGYVFTLCCKLCFVAHVAFCFNEI